MKRVFASVFLLLAAGLAAWQYARQPKPVALTPSITGKTEYCLTCHADLPVISASHPVETFGCVLCHGGERLALNTDLAHSTLRGGANPSDLSVVQESCGGANCHSGDSYLERDHIQRVMTSLQATYAGAIAGIRYSFGAQAGLKAEQGIFPTNAEFSGVSGRLPVPGTSDLPDSLLGFDPATDTNPSVLAFSQNCLNCHLSAQPADDSPDAMKRMTGCAACHSPGAGSGSGQAVHRLTTAIPYTQCNTCHNRGNYDLRTMQFIERTDAPTDRLHDYYQPIAQFTKCEYELDCVDCHTRLEVMGDGRLYNNQKEAQNIQCKDCHGTLDQPPRTNTIQREDNLAMRLAFLNPVVDLKVGDVILVSARGEPLWNILQQADGSFILAAKVTGARYPVPLVQGSACQQKPDQQESRYCHACHEVQK